MVDGTLLTTLRGHTAPVDALAVALGGTVYSGSADGTIRAWSGEDYTLLRTLRGHTTAGVRCLVVGPDGTLFSGSKDTVLVWCGECGVIIRVDSPMWSLALGPKGKLYAGLHNGAIVVW
jgi:WD40 repeat protein